MFVECGDWSSGRGAALVGLEKIKEDYLYHLSWLKQRNSVRTGAQAHTHLLWKWLAYSVLNRKVPLRWLRLDKAGPD